MFAALVERDKRGSFIRMPLMLLSMKLGDAELAAQMIKEFLKQRYDHREHSCGLFLTGDIVRTGWLAALVWSD